MVVDSVSKLEQAELVILGGFEVEVISSSYQLTISMLTQKFSKLEHLLGQPIISSIIPFLRHLPKQPADDCPSYLKHVQLPRSRMPEE
jgi:hypothetical protein